MSDVQTTVSTGNDNLVTQPFAYVGYTERIREQTAIARSELRFSWGVTMGAPGVGNNQVGFVSITLPGTFAYAIMDMYAAVEPTSVAETNDWPTTAAARLVASDNSFDVRWGLQSFGVTSGPSGFEARQYCSPQGCTPNLTILEQTQGGNTGLQLKVRNNTADSVAVGFVGMIRVLSYDIEQAHYFDINTPQLIR